jgi:DNA-binding GntR family transcriptional regulator
MPDNEITPAKRGRKTAAAAALRDGEPHSKPKGAQLEAHIYDGILRAIVDGHLPPGTKLVEDQVAAAFGASRERARKVLHRLVHEHRLTRIVNRGVFVPKPTISEARQVYKARRILEAGIIAALCEEISSEDIARLREHVRAEKEAFRRGDRPTVVRLSGAFHLLLTDALQSPDLSRFARELVTRTSLFMSLYHPLLLSDCTSDEHEMLIDALEARDVATAVRVAQDHLRAVEARLDIDAPRTAPIDVRTVLGRQTVTGTPGTGDTEAKPARPRGRRAADATSG